MEVNKVPSEAPPQYTAIQGHVPGATQAGEGYYAPPQPNTGPGPGVPVTVRQQVIAPGQVVVGGAGMTTTVVQQQPQVVMVGNCPNCRAGVLQYDYTAAGIALAVLCFPWGLICCSMMREGRCPLCGYTSSEC